jgi:hypothetical protein
MSNIPNKKKKLPSGHEKSYFLDIGVNTSTSSKPMPIQFDNPFKSQLGCATGMLRLVFYPAKVSAMICTVYPSSSETLY